MRIVFWGPRHGIGLTASMLATMTAVTVLSDMDCVLTENCPVREDLAGAVREAAAAVGAHMASGLDAAMRRLKSGPLSPGALEDYTAELCERLALFSGTSSVPIDAMDTPLIKQLLSRIYDLLELSFDLVVTDVGCDDSLLTKEAIMTADVAVIVLRQDRRLISEVLGSFVSESKRTVYLFDRYESDSRYGLSNLRLMFRELNRRNTYVLPNCPSYLDAFHDGRAVSFIKEGLATCGDSGDNAFFAALRETADGILNMCREQRTAVSEVSR